MQQGRRTAALGGTNQYPDGRRCSVAVNGKNLQTAKSAAQSFQYLGEGVGTPDQGQNAS